MGIFHLILHLKKEKHKHQNMSQQAECGTQISSVSCRRYTANNLFNTVPMQTSKGQEPHSI